MKKAIDCRNWNEYESLNGTVAFCSAGAYGKKLTVLEAKNCGCTKMKREKCLKAMVDVIGYGLVPEIEKEALTREPVKGNKLTAGAA